MGIKQQVNDIQRKASKLLDDLPEGVWPVVRNGHEEIRKNAPHEMSDAEIDDALRGMQAWGGLNVATNEEIFEQLYRRGIKPEEYKNYFAREYAKEQQPGESYEDDL